MAPSVVPASSPSKKNRRALHRENAGTLVALLVSFVASAFWMQADFMKQKTEQVAPQCAVCHLPVLDQMLNTMDRTYHPACFRCVACSRAMNGVPFLPTDGSVYCKRCWHQAFGQTCIRCNSKILPQGDEDPEYVQVLETSYHVKCYACHECNLPFSETELAYNVGGQLYCLCHAQQLTRRQSRPSSAASSRAAPEASETETRKGQNDGSRLAPPATSNAPVAPPSPPPPPPDEPPPAKPTASGRKQESEGPCGNYELPHRAENEGQLGTYALPASASSSPPATAAPLPPPASPGARRRCSISLDATGYTVIQRSAVVAAEDEDIYALPQTVSTLSLKAKPTVTAERLYALPQDSL
eukprot:m.278231 g.278231  ORF g.278231 m.278231 type:complete len:356 (-) comp19379_c2_seq3:130-1197(-)